MKVRDLTVDQLYKLFKYCHDNDVDISDAIGNDYDTIWYRIIDDYNRLEIDGPINLNADVPDSLLGELMKR